MTGKCQYIKHSSYHNSKRRHSTETISKLLRAINSALASHKDKLHTHVSELNISRETTENNVEVIKIKLNLDEMVLN